jgi:hypothetical protein
MIDYLWFAFIALWIAANAMAWALAIVHALN